MEQEWKKVSADKASHITRNCDLPVEALALLTEEMRPEAYILALSGAKRWMDAAQVMAHVLPRREAVWWACMCAQTMDLMSREKGEQLALSTAEKWVFQPTEAHRDEAFRVAQESTTNGNGTLCALAVAMGAETPPAPENAVRLDGSAFPGIIFAIVVTAASEGDGSRLNERLQESLQRGQEIACGGNGKLEESADRTEVMKTPAALKN